MDSLNNVNKERYLYLDLLRVFSLLSITSYHALNRSFDNFGSQITEYASMNTGETIWKAAWTVFGRYGIYIFIMITGALILNKSFKSESDIKTFYKRNWGGLLITTEIWFAIIYWEIKILSGDSFQLSNIPHLFWGMIKTMLFTNQVTLNPMWYMNMILCLYLILPFVSIILEKFPARVLYLPLGMLFLTAFIVPNINTFLDLIGSTKHIRFALQASNLVSMYMIYIFIGYCIHNGKFKRIPTWVLWAIIIISSLASIAIQVYGYSLEQNFLFGHEYFGFVLVSGSVFELMKRLDLKMNTISSIYVYLSRISFAIYLMHTPIMEIIDKYMNRLTINHWVEFLILWGGSLSICILVIYLLSKNKYLKRYLFLIK